MPAGGGLPAVSDGDTGTYVEPGVPESQEEALDLASYVCGAQYPLDPVFAQDWTQDQLRLAYDYWDQYCIPCMEAHGYTISRADQPSRETYVAAFHTSERISWWPNSTSMELLSTSGGCWARCAPSTRRPP